MKILSFVIFFIFCYSAVASSSILDVLEKKQNHLFLKQHLKKDISSVFPAYFNSKSFAMAFEAKNYKKALKIWQQSILKTDFANSSTGHALYSYLLFKNGFEFLSLNHLFKNTQPKKVHSIVSQIWKINSKSNHLIWSYFYYPIDAQWQAFLSTEQVFNIGSKSSFDLIKDHNRIQSLLTLSARKNFDSFSLEWLFMLSLLKKQDKQSVVELLSWFLSQTTDTYKKDQIYITIARLLADIEENSASLFYYNKINNLSYFLLQAQEESAWLLINQKKYKLAYNKALALNYPGFSLSPSMFFVLALSQLKNCDYQMAQKTLIRFKTEFFNKSQTITTILNNKNYNQVAQQLLIVYKSKKPHYHIDTNTWFYKLRKDRMLKNNIYLHNYLRNKTKNLQFKTILQKEKKLIQTVENQIFKRIESLLKQELKQIQLFVSYFHLLEAENSYRYLVLKNSIYRQKKANDLSQEMSLYKANDLLYFPFNKNEIWLDELLNYKTNISQKCSQISYEF